MPRARLSARGPQIARPGFDVDTAAPKDMLFDPSLVAATIYATDIVTTTPYSGGDGLGEACNRYIGSHGRTFAMPPIVIPYEVVGGERRLHMNYVRAPSSGPLIYVSDGSVRATTSGFELYSRKTGIYAPGNTWRYVTLSNTLANS